MKLDFVTVFYKHEVEERNSEPSTYVIRISGLVTLVEDENYVVFSQYSLSVKRKNVTKVSPRYLSQYSLTLKLTNVTVNYPRIFWKQY